MTPLAGGSDQLAKFPIQPKGIRKNRRHIVFSRSSAPVLERVHQTILVQGKQFIVSASPIPAKVLYVKRARFYLFIKSTTLARRDLDTLFLLEHDSGPVKTNHKVSLCELTIQVDQLLAGGLIQILGFAPRIPELISKVLRVIEGEVLVNGTPCATESACNPAINQIRIRSSPRGLTVNLRTHDRDWSPRQRRRAFHEQPVELSRCRCRCRRTRLDQRRKMRLKRSFGKVMTVTSKKANP